MSWIGRTITTKNIVELRSNMYVINWAASVYLWAYKAIITSQGYLLTKSWVSICRGDHLWEWWLMEGSWGLVRSKAWKLSFPSSSDRAWRYGPLLPLYFANQERLLWTMLMVSRGLQVVTRQSSDKGQPLRITPSVITYRGCWEQQMLSSWNGPSSTQCPPLSCPSRVVRACVVDLLRPSTASLNRKTWEVYIKVVYLVKF